MNRILAGQERYNRPAVFFHWAIFLLVALAYFAIEVRGPKGTDSRVFWSNVHYLAGSLVLALAVLRIVWRFAGGAPRAQAVIEPRAAIEAAHHVRGDQRGRAQRELERHLAGRAQIAARPERMMRDARGGAERKQDRRDDRRVKQHGPAGAQAARTVPDAFEPRR